MNNEAEIRVEEITEMVNHWLRTPINSYLGSDYGFDKHAILFNPLSASNADEMLAKLRRDVPILEMLPSSSINLYNIPLPPDKALIFLEIGGIQFNLSELQDG